MGALSEKTTRRVMILLDTAAMSISFMAAWFLRYRLIYGLIFPWYSQAYSTAFILNVLIYLFLNTYRRAKHREYHIEQLDIADNLVHLLRDRLIQYVILIILMSVSHNFQDISRAALVLWFVIDVILAYIGRMLLRRTLLQQERFPEIKEHYVAVTSPGQEEEACSRLQMILPRDADCAGVITLSPEMEETELEQSLTQLPVRAHIFVYYRGPEQSMSARTAVRFYRAAGLPVSERLFYYGRELPGSMAAPGDTYATLQYRPLLRPGRIFGVRFVCTDVEKAAFGVLEEMSDSTAGRLSGEYICFSNVHTTVMAHDDPQYKDILNQSVYTFADGTPITRHLRSMGFEESERVAGPDFMDAVFRATMDGSISHYFYGSTQETIDKLGQELPRRYPGIRIAGLVSPPFRPETEEEDLATVEAMNASGAGFIWIGLGAPKQERWMAAHKGKVNGVMLGVGAGFNFYAGTVKRAPLWIQRIGLEWLYRLSQDPKRLANRYFITNTKYLWYLLKERFLGESS